jgi:HEAT repeat protein
MRWTIRLRPVLLPVLLTCLLAGCSSPTSAPTDPAAGGKVGAGLTPAEKSDIEAGTIPPAPLPPPESAKAAALATKEGASQKTGGEIPEAGDPPPTTADMPALIDGFQSQNPVRVFETTEQFRKLPADVRRTVLAELSAHESDSVRHHAWRAFAAWATRDDVPTLIAALQSPHEEVRAAALALLARFPNADTIGVLTKSLEDPAGRERAEELLIRAGPTVETAVLTYVAHADAGLRGSAWRILGQIGSRKSLLELERVATQADYQKDAELKAAIGRIRERLRQ